MATKPYIPCVGDVTDDIVGAHETTDDLFNRAAEGGWNPDDAIHDYRDAVRTVGAHSVQFDGWAGMPGHGARLRGRWRRGSDGVWRPVDLTARRQAAEGAER